MKMVKRLTSLVMVVVLSVVSTVSVFAAEVESPTFKDVVVGSPYYEAVEYLADKGVVKGCGDSLFNPNNNITLNHFAIMMIRAFGDKQYENRLLPICFSNGWIDISTVSQDPNGDISRGGAYQALFTAKNVSVFSESNNRVGWEDYANSVEKLTGIMSGDLSKGITRGEIAELFYYFMTNDVVIEVPEELKGIVFINETQNLGNYVAAFEKVPSVVLEKFKTEGWKIDLTNRNLGKYLEETGVVANGLCDYGNKIISLKTPYSLVHELGHFVDYLSDYNLGIDELYSKEGNILGEELGYKVDNSREYFAEYFVCYIYAKEEIAELEILKEKTPLTFKYFEKLENNGWVM